MNAGTYDPDFEEELAENPEILRKARRRFEEFFDSEDQIDRHSELVKAYEHLLYEKRRVERHM